MNMNTPKLTEEQEKAFDAIQCAIAANINAVLVEAIAQPEIGDPFANRQLEALMTEPAFAAADGERYDNAIADLEIGDPGAKLNHLTHIFMAEDVAAFHRGLISVQEVQVRAANRASGDPDDRITRVLDGRI